MVPLFLEGVEAVEVIDICEGFFKIFDYTQNKAMKERHVIEKIRKKADDKNQTLVGKTQETRPIKIGGGIQYRYKYEEKTGATRHMLCELWSVRGHYRHYKSGKVSYIAPYQKGKARKEKTAPGHTYEIVD